MSVKGRIHSVESFGAADGPGVRYVIFFQGCPIRCKYCHNPDTWKLCEGTEMSADELISKALRYKSYWKNDGGITVSGGEPLMQMDFLTELLCLAKKNGINTVIDTSGSLFSRNSEFIGKFDKLMEYTDLVLLDIKEIDPQRHKNITGADNKNILDMAEYFSQINKPVWIRHVLVPEYSDYDEDLYMLSEFISKLNNIKKIEILPYHTLGKFKWKKMGMPYQLELINSPSMERIENAKKILGIK